MADKEPLPTYDWFVNTKDRDQRAVHAAYFNDATDGRFVIFKSGDHKMIYMIAKDQVVDIGRHDPQRIPLDVLGRRRTDDMGQDHSQ